MRGTKNILIFMYSVHENANGLPRIASCAMVDMMIARAAISIILMSAKLASAEGAVVLYEQAECLRDNVEHYLEFVDGPTLVFPGFCSEGKFSPSPAEVAKATSQNSSMGAAALVAPGQGASTISFDEIDPEFAAGITRLSSNSKATMLVLSQDQLTCLRDHFDNISERHTLETQDRRKVDIARLLFELCG